MALIYLSSAGDVLDEIAFNQYGDCSSDTLAAVLLANPGLADLGPVLPAGVQVTLPDAAPITTTVTGVSLWD
ncbi:tail protein X [Dyella sp.]|uniref:tail protein X n=1 Tax=Dyella sp. TaxID=1869338 RepID=UPI00283FB79A|nr:tail protein X [Dyella sp.]MDR3445747.1 tail protein X [Dyella sp.]